MQGYLYDMHIHTREVSPCGKIPAPELVHLYKQAGYRGIVITDHFSKYGLESILHGNQQDIFAYYLTGYKLARQEGLKIGLTVLWGLELTFNGADRNDYLIYGLEEEFLLNHSKLLDLNLQTLRELTDRKQVLICQAHPFRPGIKPALPELLDGVEVYNGNPRHDSCNQLAEAYAGKHHLLQISGSDTHQVEDVGRGGIYLPEPAATAQELIALLKKHPQLPLLRT